MTNYVLLHGSGPAPDMWFPWLEKELAQKGFPVWMPTLPKFTNPDLSIALPFIQNNSEINSESVLLGHSSGCPLILSYLENSKQKIAKAVLVAGYFPIPGEKEKIWQDKYDFAKIKANCEEFIFIVSDNDPWGCTDKLSRPYFEALGGTMVVIKGGGHFGSNHFKQPLHEFPFLLKLI